MADRSMISGTAMKNGINHDGAVMRGTLYVWIAAVLMVLQPFLFSQEPAYSREHQLDINNASYEAILLLPVSREIADRLYERVEYEGPFTSIFQLRDIEGIDQETLLMLKPLIRIEPFARKSEREARLEELYFKFERWGGDDGADQSLVDFWITQALEPVNVNEIRYDDLANLQGVSPVDAAAIINYRNQVGTISSLRDMRGAPNLSYFGYRNARDFVSFEQRGERRPFQGHFLFRSTDVPFLTEEAEFAAETQTPILQGSENNYPDIYTRFIGNWDGDIKAGVSHWHALAEPTLSHDLGFIEIPEAKLYFGLENRKLGPIDVHKVYVGNYSIGFGQGVVMENTDFFQPRKTGYGFRKRFIGLSGDVSRTREFKLTGAATELGYGKAHLFLFGAFDERDAKLNTSPINFNGEQVTPFNQLIVLDQRFEFAPGDDARIEAGLPQRDVVKELMYGFHAAYDIRPTSQLGFTYYESAYDRPLRPDIEEIVDPENLGQITLPDNEIYASYGGSVSDGENPFWDEAKSFRRVYGIDLNSVHENVAIQAEYAELEKQRGISGLGLKEDGNPWALVASAYVQYNNFNLLGLYRNYQLEFDNPYQRSFSNYRRFKRTIYEDYFYLRSPFDGQLYTNNPQPQAEEGFYFYTRYQMSRKLTLTAEYDNWARKADDVTQYRLRGTLEFRPIFPLRFYFRQKYQAREALNNLTTEHFENLEFRLRVRMLLSRFDELGLVYMNSVTKFRPRPRLYYPTSDGPEFDETNLAGNVASPGEAIGGFYTHNFNEWLKVRGFLGYYNGFFWNFEDTQFFVGSSNRGSLRWWVSLYSRVSNSLSVRLKYTRDRAYPVTFIHTRTTDNEEIEDGIDEFEDGKYYQGDLLQPRQEFFYFELNFHL